MSALSGLRHLLLATLSPPLEESGSFFVHLNLAACPLCGTPPDEQHLNEECDGNVESTIYAARGEIEKVEKLSSELKETVSELEEELTTLRSQQEQIAPELQFLTEEIQRITAPLSDLQTNIGELVSQAYSFQRIVSKVDDLESYREKKEALRNAVPAASAPVPSRGPIDITCITYRSP